MKKILIVSAVVYIFCICGYGQKIKDSEVPAAVKTSFTKIYPGVTAKWEKEKGNYEAEFKKDAKSMSATFEPSGTMLESETAIKESEFPAAAINYLKTNYKGKHIKEFAKITGSDGGVTYEAEVEGKDVIFDSAGKFLKEVKD
jgi:hypothetical protein